MNTSILLARDVLRQRYGQLHGPAFRDFAPAVTTAEPETACGAAWEWVDATLRPTEMPHGALLTDREIATSLYILPFLPETRLEEQLARAARIEADLAATTAASEKAEGPGGVPGRARVVVHWLVEREELFRWVQEIGRIQAETRHLDAVAVDAIVRHEGDWKTACETHGFPRLLLTTRQVLRRTRRHDVEAWASADARVRAALHALPASIPDEPARARAREVAARFGAVSAAGANGTASAAGADSTDGTASAASADGTVDRPEAAPGEAASAPSSNAEHGPAGPDRRFLRFSVRRFRNLDDVSFCFGEVSGVHAVVIHGPNGTGKSNVVEALSLALCGSSRRYQQFLEDRNVTTSARSRRYLERYLRPTRSGDEGDPVVGFDDEATQPLRLCDGAGARAAQDRISGTVLAQEDSASFLTWNAADLGSYVMGDASRLAADVLAFVQERYEKARQHQQTFLRRWNLSASIRKVTTIRERVARRVLADRLPEPTALVSWLQNPAFADHPVLGEARALATEWEGWREALALMAVRMAEAGDNMTRYTVIAGAEERHARMLAAARAWLESVRERVRAWPEDLADRIARAGEALSAANRAPTDATGHEPLPDDERDRLVRERTALETEQQEVATLGKRLRVEREHLESVNRLLERGELDGRCCPTCGTNLGGSEKTVSAVRARQAHLDRELANARQRYREVATRRSRIDARLAAAGDTRSRSNATSEQASVVQAVSWLLPPGTDVLERLRDAAGRSTLCHVVNQLHAMPDLPEVPTVAPGEPGEPGREIGQAVRDAYRDLEAASAGEAAWQEVYQRLTGCLSDIVKEHLPATLGALWGELAWNLTPAPWQVRHRPAFSVRSSRNQPHAMVAMDVAGDPRHARYLLNEGEIRTLGLAWFLTRYFTHGRFDHALLVLDDPAAAMDEPTFHDYVALTRALLALHRVQKTPLTLITLLHDDRRARSAAAGTGASLFRLRWNDGQGVLVDADHSSTRRVEE